MVFVAFTVSGYAQKMRYLSSKIKKEQNAEVGKGSSLLKLEIQTNGPSEPLVLTEMNVKTGKGGYNKEDDFITVYYTGNDSGFFTARSFGCLLKKGSFLQITGNQTLKEGRNYFWIIYPGKTRMVEITSFSLGIQKYSLQWADEFEGNKIDTLNWSFEKGFVRNQEHQWYQNENAFVTGGHLVIEARREHKPNPLYVPGSDDWRKSRQFIEYTSSSMKTSGRQSWQYGRFEMKGRIDTVSGYWPAWWTLGVKGRWPFNGEIDIMEFYRGKLLANIAVGRPGPSAALWYSNTMPVSKFGTGWKDSFHVWRMDWDEDGIGLFMDDQLLNYQPQMNLFNRDSLASFPFRQKHYMLINLAIGGENGGDPGQTSFPLRYEVDYVRVLKKIPGAFTPVGSFVPKKIKGL